MTRLCEPMRDPALAPRQPNEPWRDFAVRRLAHSYFEADLSPRAWAEMFGAPWPGPGYAAAIAAQVRYWERMIRHHDECRRMEVNAH